MNSFYNKTKRLKWTEEEDKIIKEKYGTLKYSEIIKLLPNNRTVASVEARLSVLGIKKSKRGKNLFSRTNPRCEVDDNYFSTINKENSYWAGFLAADGCIKKGDILKLKVSLRDREQVDKLITALGYSGNYTVQKFKTKNGRESSSIEVSIRSEKICSDLEKNFLITRKKTKTLKFPSHLTGDNLDAYIIGYLDGDGTIGYYGRRKKQKYLNIIAVGTKDVCNSIKERFKELSGAENELNKEKSEHLYRYAVSGNNAVTIYNHLKNVSPSGRLKRKWRYHPKSWGFEDWIVNNEKYCGKLLYFNKGKRCSYHYHKIKEETFYLQSGKILLKYSYDEDLSAADTIEMNPGDTFDVPVGLVHQMIALQNSELFEFSTQHFESDSYRIVKGD